VDLFNYFIENISSLVSILQEAIDAATDMPRVIPSENLVTHQRTGRRGRPRIQFNETFLATALDLRSPADIAPVVGASSRTVRREALRMGLRAAGAPVYVDNTDADGNQVRIFQGRQSVSSAELSDAQLDVLIHEALTLFPDFGRAMISGFLKSKGHDVPRRRIKASFERVNGPPAEFGRRRIERRKYQVPGPNSMWHHDGHHSK
jgi:hypothetical protein